MPGFNLLSQLVSHTTGTEKRGSSTHRLQVEPLEPRVLLAADTVGVVWDAVVSTSNEQQFGINVWSGMNRTVIDTTGYQTGIADIAPSLVRFHHNDQWRDNGAGAPDNPDIYMFNAAGTDWNYAALDTVLGNSLGGVDTARVFNVAGWPSSFDANSDGLLDADANGDYSDFANLVADAVSHITQQNYNVDYLEILNEEDNQAAYAGAAGATEIANIYNDVASAVRAVNPNIKLVGPAWTQPFDNADIQTFMDNVDPTLIDVFSYHHYARSSALSGTEGPVDLLNRADNVGNRGNTIRTWLDDRGLNHVDIWLTEWNIFANSGLDDQKLMRDSTGLAFDALTWKYALESGNIEAMMTFNDGDLRYGKLDPSNSYAVRDNGRFMRLMNDHFSGQVVNVTTTNGGDNGNFDLLAVQNGDSKAVAIINRSGSSMTVDIDMNGWTPGNTIHQEYIFNDAGSSESTLTWSGDPQDLSMGLYEVRVWVFDDPQTPSSGTVVAADSFESGDFAGGAGWTGAWTTSGDLRLLHGATEDGERQLEFGRNGVITQTVELNNPSSAQLNFAWQTESVESTDILYVEADDGSGYQTLAQYSGDTPGANIPIWQQASLNLSGLDLSGSIDIRFRSTLSSTEFDHFFLDDVEVSVAAAPAQGVVASDGFESGGLSGGAGWDDPAWAVSGNTTPTVLTSGGFEGNNRLEMTGSAVITRGVDLSGAASATLDFAWQTDSFDATKDEMYIEVNDGSGWSTVLTIDGTTSGLNGGWNIESVDLSSFSLNSAFEIRFRGSMSSGAFDHFFLDAIEVLIS